MRNTLSSTSNLSVLGGDWKMPSRKSTHTVRRIAVESVHASRLSTLPIPPSRSRNGFGEKVALFLHQQLHFFFAAPLIVWLIILTHLGLLCYGACIHGPVLDEYGHLPAGWSCWETGSFDLYRVNPPLIRLVAALPLMARNPEISWEWSPEYSDGRPEFVLGHQLAVAHGPMFLTFLRDARFVCLTFSLLGLWVIWRWSSELFGKRGAVISVTMWAFSPLVLTNAQLITPDIGATALGAWACYHFRNWLKHRCTRMAIVCGIFLGLAQLTKFTWVILFGIWPLQYLGHWWFARTVIRRRFREDIRDLVLMLLIGIYVINVGYCFEDSLRPLKEYRFLSQTLSGNQDHSGGNIFDGPLLGNLPLPLPRNYVLGIDRQKLDFEWGYYSYLRGKWRDNGWWYFYAYALAIKMPLGFLALLFVAAMAAWSIKWSSSGFQEAWSLLLPGIGLFVFVSSQASYTHHCRYVLPAVIFFLIGAGVLGSDFTHRWLKRAAVVLLVCGVTSSLFVYPHSHCFFNVLIGEIRNGPQHLLSSNFDWGQDVLLVEKWANDHPNQPLNGVVFSSPPGLGTRELTSLRRLDAFEESEQQNSPAQIGPPPGRYAVSLVALYEEDWPDHYHFFRDLTAVAEIGYTYFIYEVPPLELTQPHEPSERTPRSSVR